MTHPGRWPKLWTVILPALIPPATTIAFYYWPAIHTKALPFLPGPDAKLYLYQFKRAYEAGGKYWEIAHDPMVGRPYPHGLAKHPGFLEGIDLQEIAAATGRWLSPDAILHLCVLCMMSFNGWIAAWLIYRTTQSSLWSAVGSVLIVVNSPTAFRVWGNLNLYKHGYVLLACFALYALLKKPSWRRGVALGICCGMILQGSFYYAFLTALAFTAVGIGHALRGNVNRTHVPALFAAGATFAVLAIAAAFPILIMENPLAHEYFERTLEGVWTFGAELWQYFRPMAVEDPFPEFNYGGGNFPGYFILIGSGVYVLARIRGWIERSSAAEWIDWLLILSGILVVLSLRGGPGILLFDFVKSFRCFDRAGLIAVGICCAAIPAAVALLLARIERTAVRRLAAAGALAVVAVDVGVHHQVKWALSKHCWLDRETIAAANKRLLPGWVDWLAHQPPNARLAAFAVLDAGAFGVDMWHNDSLHYRANVHHRATLNGAEQRLIAADLKMLGSTLERMTPGALRFVASLGYPVLAFDERFLQRHPWTPDLPWLSPIEQRGTWRIFHTNERFRPLPPISLAEAATLLAAGPVCKAATNEWLTHGIDVEGFRVMTDSNWANLQWRDERGKIVGKPGVAFGQRLWGGSLPALRVRAPARPGHYSLEITDRNGALLARKEYVVEPAAAPAGSPSPVLSPVPAIFELDADNDDAWVALTNHSNRVIRARNSSSRHPTGFEFHPAMNDARDYPIELTATFQGGSTGPAEQTWIVPLPRDLEPGKSIRLPVAERLLCGIGGCPQVQLAVRAANPGANQEPPIGTPPEVTLTLEPSRAVRRRTLMSDKAARALALCVDFVSGDFDGDGQTDWAGRRLETGAWEVFRAGSSAASPEVWGAWSPQVQWGSVVAADFNGDGCADIAGMDVKSGVWWVAISKKSCFESSPWGGWSGSAGWTNALTADFDGDGKDDIAARPAGSRLFYVGNSREP